MTERNPYLPDAYSEAIIAAGSKKTNPYLPTDDGMDAALSVALRTDPDRTARAHTLSAKTGIPISTVERNPEAAEKQAQLSDMKSQVDQISPLGRGWLIDPANAALVKDDMDSVSMLDEIWNTVGTVAGHAGNALKRGALRVGQGFNQFVAEESAEQALDAERSFGEIIGDQLGGYRSVPNPIDLLQSGERYASSRLFGGAQEAAHARLRNVGEFARRIQETPKSPTAEASQNAILEAGKKGFMPAIDAVLEDPLGAMALGTEIALEFVPQLAISSVATATGGPASGAATLGLTSAFTERYSSPAEFLAERGYDLTDPEEVNRALEDPALLRAAASYGFTRGLIIGTFDAASGGLAGKALSSGIIRNFLLQAVAQAGLGGGGEAAAQYATTGKVDAGEVVLEAVGEFAAAPIEVMGVGGHFAKTRRQKGLLDDQRVAAEEDIDKLKRTRDALSNGKLEGRSTDKVKELINRLTKDGMVYLDVNGADEYFQKSGEDADTWYQWMGVEDQVARARAGEGMIEVSTADFLTVQGIDDHLDGLAADIRLTDGGLTMRQVEQAETFNEKRLNDVLADVRDEDAAREMAQAEAADVVYDDVLSQLNATNVYDIDAARYQATVWQHTIRTLAARTGRDVAELYGQFKPTIKTAIEKEGRFHSDVALERILERVRMNERGELKSSRQSATPVLDHLKTLGGVRKGSNLAGELNAMGITPRTHRGLFKKETDKGALGDVDNLEPRDILAEIQNDGTYADRDAVLESVRREWIDKKPTRTPDEQAEAERLDGSLQDFADLMDHLGLSLDMADETIMARINEAMAKEGGVFNQPVNASVDPTRMVNVVDLSNLPFTVKTNADLRNELHVWANEEIRTADQDRIAKILPKHVRHIAFSSVRPKRRDKKTRQRAVENIIDLLFEAPLIESAPNKKRATKSKVNSYHRFYVPIRDGNNIRVARIVAEQTDKGIALNPDQFDVYDLVLEDEKAPRRLSATNQGSPSSLVARGPMQVSIQDMLTGVKGMDKKSYFQGPRGSFNPQTFTINLFQSANLSTFLHESGHGFLEIMRTLALDENAPDQLRQDWQTILDFMGIDEMPESLTDATPYHEKFARAFEGYLMEGKAPSAELRPIFRRFKDWLVDAYKDLRGLSRDAGHKVEVTPEIAAVFDRMLATDEEIAKAVSDTGWRPAFRNAKEAGLSDAEYDKWAAAYEEAEQVAREKMLSRILKDLKREKKAWWKAELADVRKDVEIKINNSPVYNVINFLRRGETLNGAEIGKPFKLDVDRLMEYGPEVVKMLPGGKYGLHKKGGKNPDIAAGIFGFRSGEEMVDQIIAASIVTQSGKTRFLTPAQAIDRRADEIMKERHGHVLDENRLRNEAAEAMHNVDAAELLTMELNVLRKKRTQDIHDKAARRVAAEQGGNFDTRQENADEAVGTLQSDGYGRSEAAFETGANKARKEAGVNQRRAERAAVREARATDVPLAVLREAAIREVSHFSVAELNRLSKFHVAEIRASKAAELALAKRDIDNALLHKRAQVWNHLLYTEGLKAQKKADSITRRLKKAARRKTSSALNVDYHKKMRAVLTAHGFPASLDMAAARQTVLDLADWVEVQNNDGAQIVLADAALSTMDYKAMSFWQFQDLDNAIKNLAKNGRERSDKAREDFRRKMEALGTHIYENNNVRKPRSIEETKLGVAARGIAKFTSAHRKAEFLLRELDGFADLGPVWDAIYKPINDAANKAETLREDAVLKMKDLFKLYHKDGILNRKRFIREIGDSLSKEAVIAVALNMGNADNLDRVQSGFGWDDSQLNAVLSRLDDRDWDFVQATWDYIDSFWPEISGLEERMTGVAPLKVDATPFVTPSGRELRGGYYPIKYDPSATPEAGRDSVDDIYKELISGGWARAATRHGHTKARVGGGGNRQVLLSLEVIPQHIEQVIQDIAYREAINHVDKVIKSRPVQDAIVATKGQPAYEELTPWVKDIATNDVAVDPVWWAKVAKHLRVGLSVAEMGFSLRTALVQPLGLTQTMARLGEGKTLKAFGKYLFSGAHLSQATKFAKEKSVFMRNRSKLFDREVADQVRKLKMGPLSDAKVLYFSLIAKTDEMVAVPTWMAGYDEGMGRWGDEAKAIDYADSVVRMTQSSGHVKDLARIQRGSEGHKLFTAFYSFFSAFHNMGVDTLKQTGQKHSIAGKAFHLTRQATWLVLVPVIANEIFLNGLLAGEEDDEEKMNKLVKAIGTFAGSGMVGVRDAANFFGTDYGYSFSPLARTAETILQASAAVGEAVFDPEEFSRSDARNLLMAFGYAGHLPTRQAWRTLDYLYQYSEGNIDEFSLHSALVTGYKKH